MTTQLSQTEALSSIRPPSAGRPHIPMAPHRLGTLMQELTAVLLGRHRGRQVDGDHLQQGVPSRQPAAPSTAWNRGYEKC